MKKPWKDIEGSLVRIDVGSTAKEALSDSMPAQVICFTTDGKIIFNGVEYPNMKGWVKIPYIIEYVGESSNRKLPQILMGGEEVSNEDLSLFFDTYPLEEIIQAAQNGRTIVCKVNQSKHPATIIDDIYLNVINIRRDSRPTYEKLSITFRWCYNNKEYETTASLTLYSDSTSDVPSIVRKQIDMSALREELENLKSLLTLTTTNY